MGTGPQSGSHTLGPGIIHTAYSWTVPWPYWSQTPEIWRVMRTQVPNWPGLPVWCLAGGITFLGFGLLTARTRGMHQAEGLRALSQFAHSLYPERLLEASHHTTWSQIAVFKKEKAEKRMSPVFFPLFTGEYKMVFRRLCFCKRELTWVCDSCSRYLSLEPRPLDVVVFIMCFTMGTNSNAPGIWNVCGEIRDSALNNL